MSASSSISSAVPPTYKNDLDQTGPRPPEIVFIQHGTNYIEGLSPITPPIYKNDLDQTGPRPSEIDVTKFSPLIQHIEEGEDSGPLPLNSHSSLACTKVFDTQFNGQKSVQEILSTSDSVSSDKTSLKDTIDPLISRIGLIFWKEYEESCGTCTLITSNLVITARHVVLDYTLNELSVIFGYKDTSVPQEEFRIEGAVEENANLDYVILKIARSALEKPMGFNWEKPTRSLALLHHPLNRVMQVSLHSWDDQYTTVREITTFHDTNPGSSGGAYFDIQGRFTAIHRGLNFQFDTTYKLRKALTLQSILNNDNSYRGILQKLRDGLPINLKTEPLLTLEPVKQEFRFIDEEGAKAHTLMKIKLREIFHGKDMLGKNISKLSYADSISAIIAAKAIISIMKDCYYRVDLHRQTSQFSIKHYVESDHTLPCKVWKKLAKKAKKDPDLKNNRLVIYFGDFKDIKDKKEIKKITDTLPAITLPYDKHQLLKTTGAKKKSKKFREKLIELCKTGETRKIARALLLCFRDYRDKGISLTRSDKGVFTRTKPEEKVNIVVKTLDLYVKKIQAINEDDKNWILRKLKLLP